MPSVRKGIVKRDTLTVALAGSVFPRCSIAVFCSFALVRSWFKAGARVACCCRDCLRRRRRVRVRLEQTNHVPDSSQSRM